MSHKDKIFYELCSLSAEEMEYLVSILHKGMLPNMLPYLLSWAEDAHLELLDEENEE